MPARFNAYPPDSAALVRLLDENVTYRIGRASECEVRIDHPSVSRFHAEIQSTDSGWNVRDTGSKNGLRVDGHPALTAKLEKNSWFTIGDVHCSLERLGPLAADSLRAQTQGRRALSRQLSARLSQGLDIGALLPQTLDVVLELSGLERGFVLYAPQGQALRVRASRGLRASDIAKADFSGSIAAVKQALSSRRSVVCCDTEDDPLGARPSVRLGGIRAIVCVPLQVAEHALGIVYVDSRQPGPQVTELDLELIETVAQHASAALSARRLQGELEDLLKAAADAGLDAPRWDDLLQQSGSR